MLSRMIIRLAQLGPPASTIRRKNSHFFQSRSDIQALQAAFRLVSLCAQASIKHLSCLVLSSCRASALVIGSSKWLQMKAAPHANE